VKIVALRTAYIVRERYINATGCLNIIIEECRAAGGLRISNANFSQLSHDLNWE
jgi:hypothetical protein